MTPLTRPIPAPSRDDLAREHRDRLARLHVRAELVEGRICRLLQERIDVAKEIVAEVQRAHDLGLLTAVRS